MGFIDNRNLGEYKELKPFRYWCQKVLPLVYDDSLSYYELLCKVVDYLNKTMEDVETLHEDVVNLDSSYKALVEYVNSYFENLDVQEEINKKLDDMASDGSLYALIEKYVFPYIESQNERIDVLVARMDSFSRLAEGSTTGDAELTDIRVSSFGKTYPNAGDSVRAQYEILRNQIMDNNEWNLLVPYITNTNGTHNGVTYTWNNGICTVTGTSTSASVNVLCSKRDMFANVVAGEKYYADFQTTNTNVRLGISFFDSSNNPTYFYFPTGRYFTVPSNAVYMSARLFVNANVNAEAVVTRYGLYKIDSNISMNEYPETYIYSDMEKESGWWNGSGYLESPNSFHSKLLRINPHNNIYLGYVNDSTSNPVVGLFFDKYKRYISPMLREDIQTLNYNPASMPSTFYTREKYADIRYYDATHIPDEAVYFSYNLSIAPAVWNYRIYVSNKPVFFASDYGNYVSYEGNVEVEPHRKEKILVIGASTAMIDRYNPRFTSTSNPSEFLVGWQEWLLPYVDTIDTYGLSGGTWRGAKAGYTNPSIIDTIQSNDLNLEGYDTYILMGSNNGIYGQGDNLVYTDTNPDTYFGGLRIMISRILAVSPNARIILVIAPNRSLYYTSEGPARECVNKVAEGTRLLAEEGEYELVDERNIGFNRRTYTSLTYDGTHYNNAGAKLIGLNMRKKILGF